MGIFFNSLSYVYWAAGLVALYFFLRHYIGSTVDELIAHQFDVKLERFKQDFTRDLHALDRKDKYQLAALDKRLETHQKAFYYSIQMLRTWYPSRANQEYFHDEIWSFWNNNCLYLHNRTRKEFLDCLTQYSLKTVYEEQLKEARTERDSQTIKQAMKERNEGYQRAQGLLNTIQRDVDLEAMAVDPKDLVSEAPSEGGDT